MLIDKTNNKKKIFIYCSLFLVIVMFMSVFSFKSMAREAYTVYKETNATIGYRISLFDTQSTGDIYKKKSVDIFMSDAPFQTFKYTLQFELNHKTFVNCDKYTLKQMVTANYFTITPVLRSVDSYEYNKESVYFKTKTIPAPTNSNFNSFFFTTSGKANEIYEDCFDTDLADLYSGQFIVVEPLFAVTFEPDKGCCMTTTEIAVYGNKLVGGSSNTGNVSPWSDIRASTNRHYPLELYSYSTATTLKNFFDKINITLMSSDVTVNNSTYFTFSEIITKSFGIAVYAGGKARPSSSDPMNPTNPPSVASSVSVYKSQYANVGWRISLVNFNDDASSANNYSIVDSVDVFRTSDWNASAFSKYKKTMYFLLTNNQKKYNTTKYELKIALGGNIVKDVGFTVCNKNNPNYKYFVESEILTDGTSIPQMNASSSRDIWENYFCTARADKIYQKLFDKRIAEIPVGTFIIFEPLYAVSIKNQYDACLTVSEIGLMGGLTVGTLSSTGSEAVWSSVRTSTNKNYPWEAYFTPLSENPDWAGFHNSFANIQPPPNHTVTFVTFQNMIANGYGIGAKHGESNIYTYQFKANGGSWTNGDTSRSGTYTDEHGLNAESAPTRSGYVFLGWQLDSCSIAVSSGGWPSALYQPYLFYKYKGNVVFSARWSKAGVKYLLNGGSVSAPWTANSNTMNVNSVANKYLGRNDNTSVDTNGIYRQLYVKGVKLTLKSKNEIGITKTAYNFSGWRVVTNNTVSTSSTLYSGGGAYAPETLNSTATNNNTDIYLQAQWTAAPYTATFAPNNGTWSDSATGSKSTSYTIETKLAAPTTISRTGYVFTGWKVTTAAGNWTANKVYTSNALANSTGYYGNVTFTAQWRPVKITLNANGGTLGTSKQYYQFYGSKYTSDEAGSTAISSVTKSSKTNYTFTGYWTATSGGTKVVNADGSLIANIASKGNYKYFTVDTTVYAQYTATSYTATFVPNGGTWSDNTTANKTVSYTVLTKLAAPATVSKTGYVFTGWKVTTAGGNWTANTNYANNTLANATGYYGNVTFTAQWRPVKITLNANGGTLGTSKQYYQLYGSKYVSDEAGSTNISSVTKSTKANCTFTGYWTATSGGTKVVNADGSLIANIASKGNYKYFTADTTVYAQYSGNVYTITCNKNGGTGGTDKFYEKYGVGFYSDANCTKQITSITIPKKNGYTFSKYTDSAENEIVENDGDIIVDATHFTANATINAVWAENTLVVLFMTNRNSNDNTFSMTGTNWEEVNMSEQSGIVKLVMYLLYSFAGKTEDEITELVECSDYILPSDGSATYCSYTYAEAAKKLLSNSADFKMTSSKYDFVKWNTVRNGSGTSFNDGQSVKAENLYPNIVNGSGVINLYAQWKPKTFTITYKWSDGTTAKTAETYTYGTAKSYSAVPTANGYTTSGWYSSSACTASASNITATTYGNITVYAKKTPITYYVKYFVDGNLKYTETCKYDTTYTFKTMASVYTLPAGYKFSASTWNTNASITGTTYTPSASYKNLTTTNNGIINLYVKTEIIKYTAKFNHWMLGLTNNEGTNGSKNAIMIGQTSRTFNYGTNLTIATTDHLTSLPNGLEKRPVSGKYKTGTSYDGSWQSYDLDKTFTTPNKDGTFELYYRPINYTITYDYNGGTAPATANPTTYNVIYGASITNKPTKAGYDFDGWVLKDTTTKVTGFNTTPLDASVFVNNTTSNATTGTFANALKSRTTGNKTLVAQWKAKTIKVYYNPNSGTCAASHTSGSTTYYHAVGSDGLMRYSASSSVSATSAVYYQTYTYGTAEFDAINHSTFGLSRTGYRPAETYTVGGTTGTAYSSTKNAALAGALDAQIKNGKTTITLYAVWTSDNVTVNIKRDNANWTNAKTKGLQTISLVNKSTGTTFGTQNVADSKYSYVFNTVPNGTYVINTNLLTGGAVASTESYVGTVVVNNNSQIKTVDYYSVTVKGDAGCTVTGGIDWIIKNGSRNINRTVSAGYNWKNWTGTKDGTAITASTNTTYSVSGIANTWVLQANTTPKTIAIKYNANGATCAASHTSGSNTYYHAVGTDGLVRFSTTAAVTASSSVFTYNYSYGATKFDAYNHGTLGLSKTGYVSAGTYTINSASGTAYSQDDTSNTFAKALDAQIEAGKTEAVLYAQWNPITYYVKYYVDGNLKYTETCKYDTTYSFKTMASVYTLPAGYKFSASTWNANSTITGTTYAPSASYKNLTTTNNGVISLYVKTEIIKYTATFKHWMVGLKNSEGTNSAKNAIVIAQTTKTFNYGTNLTIATTDHLTSLPNGLEKRPVSGKYKTGTSYEGSWQSYDLDKTFTTPNKNGSFELYYRPIDYTITYNYNGGTAPTTANPTTYNVIYGASFTNNPTRTGYTFDGWVLKDTTTKITGINNTNGGNSSYFNSDGSLKSDVFKNNTTANATTGTFAAALNLRTTGNKTVVAQWKTINYTGTFVPNGGTWSDSATGNKTASYTIESKLAAPTTISKVGYVFTGWKVTTAGGNWTANTVYANNTLANATGYYGNVTFTAQWRPLKITLNGNGGTLGTSKIYYQIYGTKYTSDEAGTTAITTVTKSTKRGHSFTGYWTATSGGTKVANADETLIANISNKGNYKFFTADTTVYAQWSANTYTITCDKNNGTNGTDKFYELFGSKFYIDTSTKTSVTNIVPPTRTGYTFDGYYDAETSNNGSGTQVIDATGKILVANTYWAANTTVYAKWTPITYSVKYNVDGTAKQTVTCTYDVEYTYAALANVYTLPSGYHFAATTWNTNSSINGTARTPGSKFKNLASTNGAVVNLYVNTTPNKVTVTLKRDNENWTNAKTKGMTEIKLVNKSTNAAFGSKTVVDNTYNYVFDIVPNGTYIVYAKLTYGGSVSSTESYIGNITVNNNNPSKVANYYSVTVTGDAGCTVTGGIDWIIKGGTRNLNRTISAGYVWKNWTGTKDGTEITASTSETYAISNISNTWIMKANTTPKTISIKYHPNGATCAASHTSGSSTYYHAIGSDGLMRFSASSAVTSSSAVFVHKYSFNSSRFDAYNHSTLGLSKTGYLSAATYTIDGTTGTKYSQDDTSRTFATALDNLILANKTEAVIYAQWTPITYQVKYNGNGATSGTMANSTHTYDVAKNLTANAFKREFTVTYNYNYGNPATTTTDSTKSDFAGWAKTATGAKAYNDGQSVTNLASTQDAVVNLYAKWTDKNVTLPTLTRTGYVFNGWYTAASGGTKVGDGGASYTLKSTLTLYAQWTPITYQVKYNGNGATSGTMANSTHTYDVAKNLTANAFKREFTVTYNYNYGNPATTTTDSTKSDFAGWAKTATGAKAYNDGQSVTNLASTQDAVVNLYAKWTDKNVTLPTLTRTGYIFNGWYTAASGGTKVGDGGASYTLKSTLTLYAQWTPITYQVKYNGNGATSGTMANSTHTYDVAKNLTANTFKREFTVTYNYNYGNPATTTTDSTKSDFAGWAKTATGAKAYNDGQSVTNLTSTQDAVVNLYAKWTDKSVTLPTLTRTGYIFNGWYTAASGGTKVGNGGTSYTPTSTLTLYAQWTPITYQVKYNGNGATSGTMANSTHTYDVAKNLTANAFKREFTVTYNYNYGNPATTTTDSTKSDFAGWAKTATGAKAYNDGQSVTNLASTQDAVVNLYAKWTDKNVTLPTLTRIGYIFNGWYTAASGGTKVGNGGASYTVKSTLTLYAQWTPITYQVKYNGNGATSGTMANSTHTYDVAKNLTENAYHRDYTVTYKNEQNSYVSEAVASAKFNGWANSATGSVVYANKAAVKNLTSVNESVIEIFANWTLASVTLPIPTKTGYLFDGWYTAVTGGTKIGKAGDTYTPTGNITLYQRWTPITYQVKYNGNGATSGTMANSTHTYDVAKNLTANAFKREFAVTYNYNYGNPATTTTDSTKSDFAGWATTSTGAKAYNDGQSVINLASTQDAVVNLYAKWTDKNVTLPTLTRTGYVFNGWYTAASGGTKVGNGGASYTVKSTLTLYAQWTPITYQVKYNGNGATSGTMANSTHTYDVAKNLTANAFKREFTVTYNYNYGNPVTTTTASAKSDFAGWAKTATGTKAYNDGQSVINLASTKDAVVNLYAKWTDKSVTLPTLTRTGYIFNGWYTAASGGTKVGNGGTSYTPTSTLTLYAQWTPITYQVKYNGNGATSGTMANSTHTYDVAKNLTENAYHREYKITYKDINGEVIATYDDSATFASATFNGWAKTANGQKVYNDKQSVVNLTAINNSIVEIFANWTLGTVTLPELPDVIEERPVGWVPEDHPSDDPLPPGTIVTPEKPTTYLPVYVPIIYLEPIDQNADYTCGTDVISSFRLINPTDDDRIPDSHVNLTFKIYDGTQLITTKTVTNVVVPKNDEQLVWIKWTVPENVNDRIKIVGIIHEALYEDDFGRIEKMYNTANEDISHPAPFYPNPNKPIWDKWSRDKIPATPTCSNTGTASWSVWEYSGGTFTKQTYSINASGTVTIRPDAYAQTDEDGHVLTVVVCPNCGTENTSDSTTCRNVSCHQALPSGLLVHTRSGYGIVLQAQSNITTTVSENDYTNAQSAIELRPEYQYEKTNTDYSALMGTNKVYVTLDKVGDTFMFAEDAEAVANGDDDTRYIQTEIWFSTGMRGFNAVTYAALVEFSDIWTPSGMITFSAVSNEIGMSGTVSDDQSIE